MLLQELLIKVGVSDEASSKISGIAGSVKNGLGTAAMAGAVAVGSAVAAAGAAAVAFGKQALDSYAQYEQLVGGVDKLYGEASGQLQAYAAEAYRTSGMSANQYMEQATSFSAALINSLGGDTKKAAEQTDVAMRAMSDNVNVFGSNMQDVQNAFQGFAKQNYTMLDNLKLGYGGTKEEMERLISDANAYAAANGQAADLSIDSFSDIVTAIELVQEKQNIAGTTAREAASTIEGSVNSAKAAWENFVTGFGDENANMSELTMQLVDSVGTAAQNIVPRIGQIVSSMSQTVIEHGPEMLTSALDFVGELANGATQMLPQVLAAIGTLVMTLLQYVVSHAPDMLASALQFIATVGSAIIQNGPQILGQIASLIGNLIGRVIEAVPQMLQSGFELIMGLGDGIESNNIVDTAIAGVIRLVTGAFSGAGRWLLDAGGQIINGLISGIKSGASNLIGSITGVIGGAIDAAKDFLGIHSPSRVFRAIGDYTIQGMKLGIEGGEDGLMKSVTSAVGKAVDTANGMAEGMATIDVAAKVSASAVKPSREADRSGGEADTVVRWLADNLPRIIASYTPVMGEGDFGRKVRKAVAYA